MHWKREIFEFQTDGLGVFGHELFQIHGTQSTRRTFKVDELGDMNCGFLDAFHLHGSAGAKPGIGRCEKKSNPQDEHNTGDDDPGEYSESR